MASHTDAALRANTTAFALPANLRHQSHGGPQTVGVEALVAHVADKHLGVVAWLRALLTHFALRTLPTGAHCRTGLHCCFQTRAVVVLTAAGAE